MVNRHLARGWRGWLCVWEARKAKLESMRKGLGRMLNRELARGFGAWAEMAAERAELMQKLRKGLSFIVNRELAKALASWREAVQEISQMSRGLGHMLHRAKSRAWRAWVAGSAQFRPPWSMACWRASAC